MITPRLRIYWEEWIFQEIPPLRIVVAGDWNLE